MVEERLGLLFQVGVLFRRSWLCLSALRYVKHSKLMRAHLLHFRICSLHHSFQLLDKETNPYGETPYSTLDKIARRFRILSKDVVIDLGSGRGLASFWWRLQVGCRVQGIDNYAPFIERATWVQERVAITGVSFINANFLEVDLSKATVIYLYGTALSDEMILQLIERFKKLDSHVKIITVSYPLSDYSSAFETRDHIVATLPWGRADFYLNATSRN